MKKIWVLLIALLLVFACSAVAAADMGLPAIDPYDVVIGPYGMEASYWDDNGSQQTLTVPAGTRITVQDEFQGVLYAQYGVNYISFDGSQVMPAGETVSADYGTALPKPVTGAVSASEGLIIRSGPSTSYDSKGLIPGSAEVSYDRVFTESREWAYVTYNGVSGWACTEFIEAKAEPAKQDTEKKDEDKKDEDKKDENKQDADKQDAAKQDENKPGEGSQTPAAENTDNAAETGTSAGHHGGGSIVNTIRLLVIGLALAAAAAVAAVVLLLRSKKRREAAAAEAEEEAQAEAGTLVPPSAYAQFDPEHPLRPEDKNRH